MLVFLPLLAAIEILVAFIFAVEYNVILFM